MLQIKCPWCGLRDEEEFTPGGEAHIDRPENPASVSDEEWAGFLFTRKNTRGVELERWRHTFGCRQWFNLARHTVTHEVSEVYLIDGQYGKQENNVASIKPLKEGDQQ